jgi:hypothetical protein
MLKIPPFYRLKMSYPAYSIIAESHVSSKNNKMLRTVRLPKTPAKTDKVPNAHIILENHIGGFVCFKKVKNLQPELKQINTVPAINIAFLISLP